MASGWVKSLQCKSRAVGDVVSSKQPYHLLISPSATCAKSFRSLNDVVNTKIHKPKNPKPTRKTKPSLPGKPEFGLGNRPGGITRAVDPFFPALTELPVGHPSRNVVEIIFHSSWGPKAFPGRVEMVLKVQNLARTVTRFEEYREAVKVRAADYGCCEDHARCLADGNEVMRFHCMGHTGGGSYNPSAWAFSGGKGTAICTFSRSWRAHENAGGAKGRRAMMVCRVIAGRIRKQSGHGSVVDGRVGWESVSGENNELLVFDSRAVLPCFLIIYTL